MFNITKWSLFKINFFQFMASNDASFLTDQPTVLAHHQNIWHALSSEEFSNTLDILHHCLNSTAELTEPRRFAKIIQIDLLQPNKTDALEYLERKSASTPNRFARATVDFWAPEGPYFEEYVVGPLLATNMSSAKPLTFPFNNVKAGKGRIASLYATDYTRLGPRLNAEIEDITRELWNTTIMEGGLSLRAGQIEFNNDGTQTVWVGFLALPNTGFDSITVLPLGVYFCVDVTSRDLTEWFIGAWYYRGKMFDSTDIFREALFSPDFVKPAPNLDGPWTSTDRRGDPLPFDELPPPITVSQGKSRFAVDLIENYVEWMDFSLFMSTSGDQGLSLFDVRYRGERIIYELALQEALAHYASSDPSISGTLYFDVQGRMGRNIVSLVKGYDCPCHATFLNATYTDRFGAHATPDAICLFESDANFPIRRHYGNGYGYTSVAKNIVFTVRWIATVGNYDYLLDYSFLYDGSIEVSVRASGYISATYYAVNEDYGFRIHDFLSGALHDHVLTFKADLDIHGQKNSVQKIDIVPATVEYWLA